MQFVKFDSLDCVKSLVSLGADVNAVTNSGAGVLYHAKSDVVKEFLIEKGAHKWGHLHLIDLINNKTDIEEIKKCLPNFDVNFLSPMLHTPLSTATEANNIDIVNLLLDKGAKVNRRFHHGYTVLMRAAYLGYIDIVKALVDKGADINAISETNETALICAITSAKLDVINYLIDKGADIKLGKGNEFLPLRLAVLQNDKTQVENLLNGGADVNAKDSKGKTALYWSAKLGNKEMSDYLIANGADVGEIGWSAYFDCRASRLLKHVGIESNHQLVQKDLNGGCSLQYDTKISPAVIVGTGLIIPLAIKSGMQKMRSAFRG